MTRRWTLPLILLAFALFYLLPLATHGLWIPDETRYAQISQEMLLGGDWAAPHFMGLRYFEKPAAGYWMIAIGQAVFGQNLFGVRVASAISLGLGVLLAWVIARRLWNDPRKSLACAVLYMSFGLVAGQAGYANLDPQFTLWVNLSFVALWFAVDSRTRNARIAAWALLGAACAMGFMTKGFLALLLPVLVGLPYMLWQRRFAELVRYGLLAVVVALLVSLPWVLTVHLREPDFWRFFFWHEHIRRFAGDDAQHAEPWWFYLPLLALSSLPWALLLPVTVKQAWQNKAEPAMVFLLLWLLLPLALFSLSKGKLPTYILPCMLPLALLMGHALANRLQAASSLALRSNALLNLAAGVLGLVAVVYLHLKKPFYDNEPEHLALLLITLGAWIIANAVAALRPLQGWFAPALGMGVVVALIPAALPNHIVYNKTPDAFIADHAAELAQTHSLLSNDLGAASALAWHTKNPQVALYNTVGETKYGIAYPEAQGRQVDLDQVQAWMTQARQQGSVGVVMRVKSDDEVHEVQLLPKDGKRYEQGNIVIFVFDQAAP
ncbi:MAG: lipid IV(A) 4-amino-4-deoxy-L-arabinosyltransferase [Pseudomonas sp.]|uniref:lipid IV(A) 4-amino-4-deoxy-L-arabinosyltransferase n=1 Tax=Pseudomonas abieticivorans TaxID=2931382 RepID=UPI0020BE3DCE|nr:lipid IV(A) 4-amino-4-deoxy-L-arabinosyltransferase [Pseudomonas sp. PIA16]MDE1166651.1 lipid IV(A) 4-amino-4-deoxy-L-arabinosyltransferase [Pseudomonas sp.]